MLCYEGGEALEQIVQRSFRSLEMFKASLNGTLSNLG